MTTTVTIKARAVPVTVKLADDAQPVTIQPWTNKDFHIDGSMHLTVAEGEPAMPEPPKFDYTTRDLPEGDVDTSADEAVAAGLAARDAEAAVPAEDSPIKQKRKSSFDKED